MHIGHHPFHHIPHIHFKLPEEVEHFYLLSFARSVLAITGGLFLPLYIYKATGDLLSVLVYLLLSHGLFRVFSRPLSLYVLKGHGVEVAMFLSILLAGVEYLSVYFFGITPLLIALYGLLESLSTTLYWDAYHISFGIFGRERDNAEERAGLSVVQSAVSIILPVTSAVIINVVGFHTFYAIVFIVTVAASLFLLKHFRRFTKIEFTFKDVVESPYKRFLLFEGAMYSLMWLTPIFAYIVFSGDVVRFGLLFTFMGFVSTLLSYFVAKYIDRKHDYGLGRFYYAGAGIFIGALSLFPTTLGVYVTQLLRSAFNIFELAVVSAIYRVVKHKHPALAVGRSFYISIGKLVFFSTLIALYFAFLTSGARIDDLTFLAGVFIAAPILAYLTIKEYGRLVREAENL